MIKKSILFILTIVLFTCCNRYKDIPKNTILSIDFDSNGKATTTNKFYTSFKTTIEEKSNVELQATSNLEFKVLVTLIEFKETTEERRYKDCDGDDRLYNIDRAEYKLNASLEDKKGVELFNRLFIYVESERVYERSFDIDNNCEEPNKPIIQFYKPEKLPNTAGKEFAKEVLKQLVNYYSN